MPDAQRLVIRIKKDRDGRTALSCTRADGTTTWQRQEGGQAAFFPRHDLTHYAVESARWDSVELGEALEVMFEGAESGPT